jgi:hypothetical protein
MHAEYSSYHGFDGSIGQIKEYVIAIVGRGYQATFRILFSSTIIFTIFRIKSDSFCNIEN